MEKTEAEVKKYQHYDELFGQVTMAGLVLIVNATRLLSSSAPPAGSLSRHPFLTLAIASGFQLAAALFVMRNRLPAAALLALSTALLTAAAIGIGAWQEDREPSLPRSIMGLSLTVLLALMLGSMRGGSGWGFGWGNGGASDEDTAAASKPRGPDGVQSTADRPNTAAAPGLDVPGSFPGVILWPEIKPVTTLIAPALAGGSGLSSPARPLTIPFGGEYWMFRWPFQKPPPNSYFRRGTPAAMFFATTDRWPLQMEAYHKLGQPIGTRCCHTMQVAILNADRYPGSVSLEVILIDRDSPGADRESLGIKPVNSVPDVDAEHPKPVPETLDFSFPSSPRLRQFDEIKVIFHRTTLRIGKSARVALERFVLVP